MSIYERSQYLLDLKETMKVGLSESVFIAFDFPSDGIKCANCAHWWRDVSLQVFYIHPLSKEKQLVMRY